MRFLRILRPPAQITGGRILFKGRDLVPMNEQHLRQFRWRHISLVFQSAMNALNPVLSVGDQFVDMMQAHEPIEQSRTPENMPTNLLQLVGIDRDRESNAFPTNSRAACGNEWSLPWRSPSSPK